MKGTLNSQQDLVWDRLLRLEKLVLLGLKLLQQEDFHFAWLHSRKLFECTGHRLSLQLQRSQIRSDLNLSSDLQSCIEGTVRLPVDSRSGRAADDEACAQCWLRGSEGMQCWSEGSNGTAGKEWNCMWLHDTRAAENKSVRVEDDVVTGSILQMLGRSALHYKD